MQEQKGDSIWTLGSSRCSVGQGISAEGWRDWNRRHLQRSLHYTAYDGLLGVSSANLQLELKCLLFISTLNFLLVLGICLKGLFQVLLYVWRVHFKCSYLCSTDRCLKIVSHKYWAHRVNCFISQENYFINNWYACKKFQRRKQGFTVYCCLWKEAIGCAISS